MQTSIERIPGNERMSKAVIVNGAGIVYFKGVTPATNSGRTIEEQTTSVLEQVDKLLAEAGSSKTGLVSVNIWLNDIRDMAAMNKIYDQWVVPGHQPVRACVQAALAQPHYLIEVQVVAVRSPN
ncbi:MULTISPECIES: RidA family protein [unclassified Cupriavidus]|uniref:RidA family protein n=1 Tax=unclassified Cupriavidus TaxID=2640874 RepID=UPI001054FC6A|nr:MULTISPECIES: RidA family protein [unclassified Cupriavidus]MBF6989139.1 RidA family protein [Cupriavidus sp. IK-TO18]TDF61921.1 RidA family protein [Cupriavidus sp. L7L]